LPTAACAAVLALAFLIHPAVHREELVPLTITRALLDHTQEGQAVITNTDATLKYLGVAYGRRSLVARYELSPDSIAAFASRYGSVTVAFLDRRDSENFRRDSDGNDRFLAAARDRCSVRSTFDSDVASWARVRTFDLDSCHQ
jgi:hypothetical protein